MIAISPTIQKEKTPPGPTVQPAPPVVERITPDITGKTAAEYAYEAMRLHQEQFKGQGTPPPGILKWFGEAALAVAPINRISCAVGLTAGLMTGGTIAKIATGYGLDGKMVEKEKVPTFLQGLYKSVKNYDPKGHDSRNRWIRYGMWGFYSLGGLLGVKLGTDFAYRKVKEKNADPHYVEDYLARVSMHQGSMWSWLAALSGIFGSSSGLFALPIPGLNYGVGLAGRTISMQDRNFMIKGMNGMLSGATTPSYLRLKEGMHYMCHYLVGNPAQTPTQIEYLAFALLGPIFKDQLTAEDIQQFAEAIHKVRDPYWQPGGIPKEKRAEALEKMKEVFTGAGLEVLLIDMGLNPGTIAFDKLNGLTGKIGNISAMATIKKEQKAFLTALQERLPDYVADGEISQAQSDWVKAGIEASQKGKALPLAPPEEEILPSPGTKEETPKPSVDQPHAEAHKPNKRAIDKLIKTAAQPGDWGERVLRRPQDHSDVPLSFE